MINQEFECISVAVGDFIMDEKYGEKRNRSLFIGLAFFYPTRFRYFGVGE